MSVPSNWYQDLRTWYDDFVARTGRKPSRDEWIAAFRNLTGLSTGIGAAMYDRGMAFIATMGRVASESEQNAWIGEYLPPSATPTLRTLPTEPGAVTATSGLDLAALVQNNPLLIGGGILALVLLLRRR